MLNLGWKTSPSSQIFSIPSNFRNHPWGTETGAFPCPSCYCFVQNDRITVSVPINLKINKRSLYHLKKCRMDHKIYISPRMLKSLALTSLISQLSTSLFFYKLLFEVKKIDVRLNKTFKLNFILMFFDRVYPTRPSDTVTRYTV